ncbi:MAG: DUF4276 family protein [Anaerolineae bacterium]
MKQLVLALYVEGPTDERFLPPLVRRTAEDLLIGQDVDILDPLLIDDEVHARPTLVEQLVAAARKARGYHLLIVHQDADAPTRDPALEKRINPGVRALAQHGDDCQQRIVPLVPVRMVESWMLTDAEAFCAVLPGCKDPHRLAFPPAPHQVESLPDPKVFVAQAIEVGMAHRSRRHRWRFDFTRVQSRLGETIRLEVLQKVPSYRAFRENLAHALMELHFLE